MNEHLLPGDVGPDAADSRGERDSSPSNEPRAAAPSGGPRRGATRARASGFGAGLDDDDDVTDAAVPLPALADTGPWPVSVDDAPRPVPGGSARPPLLDHGPEDRWPEATDAVGEAPADDAPRKKGRRRRRRSGAATDAEPRGAAADEVRDDAGERAPEPAEPAPSVGATVEPRDERDDDRGTPDGAEPAGESSSGSDRRRRKRRGRRRGRGSDDSRDGAEPVAEDGGAPRASERALEPDDWRAPSSGDDRAGEVEPGDAERDAAADDQERAGDAPETEGERKRRRRGSRGGRRRRGAQREGDGGGAASGAIDVEAIPGEAGDDLPVPARASAAAATPASDSEVGKAGKKRRRRRKRRGREGSADGAPRPDDASRAESDDEPGEADAEGPTDEVHAPPASGTDDDEPRGKGRRRRKKGAAPVEKSPEELAAEAELLRTQVILVNAVEPEEKRVAVIEGERIVDLLMTAESQKTLVNDVYRGKVVNLEPAIGAAFIDFGQGRNGFLHTSDVLPLYGDDDFELEHLLTARVDFDEWSEDERVDPRDLRDEDEHPSEAHDHDDDHGDGQGEGHVVSDGEEHAETTLDDDHGHGERAHGEDDHGDAHDDHGHDHDDEGDGEGPRADGTPGDADDDGHAEAPAERDAGPVRRDDGGRRGRRHGRGREPRVKARTAERRKGRDRRPISDLLRVGDSVVVQITKDAIGDKGPTLTTYISIPGRYLVLMPSMSRTGVSRKIPDEKERRRLKKILASLDVPADMGVIVRTAGVGKKHEDLARDLDYLLGVWEGFGRRLRASRGPTPLYQESDVATRTLRDLFSAQTKRVVVDDYAVHEQMVEFAQKLLPEHVQRIELYDGERPIFHQYGIEQDFEKVFARRVDLPSGGSIVFDQAEALVAIDVNSGRTRTDSFDFEKIALKTNLEAVKEIARQIRLRDLGGIIVCDFIDMMKPSSNRQVERALREALDSDRARSKLGRISQFGLLEMTRQRLGPGTHKKVFQACPRCRGTGRVRTLESRAQAILRRLGSALTQKGFATVEVKAHPEVVKYLKEDLYDYVRAMEHRTEREIRFLAVPDQSEDSVLNYLRADGREVRPGGRRKR